MPLCCLDRLTPRYLVSRSLSLAIKLLDLSVLACFEMSCFFSLPFLLCLYCIGLGEILASEMRNRIMVLDGAMGTMIQSYYLTEEQFRGLSPPLNFSLMFWFCLCSQLISFLSGLLPIQAKSSRIIPRVSKATMIYSVSLNLMSSMRYTRYVWKNGHMFCTCSTSNWCLYCDNLTTHIAC